MLVLSRFVTSLLRCVQSNPRSPARTPASKKAHAHLTMSCVVSEG